MGRNLTGSAVARSAACAVLWCAGARAQSAPQPAEAPERTSTEAGPVPVAPATEPVLPPRSGPPPLDPPPPPETTSRPSFLRAADELAPKRRRAPPTTAAGTELHERGSPWVDFTLNSFYLHERVGNFLNFGVQVGGYLFQRMRLSARLVAPVEGVTDLNADRQTSASSIDGSTLRSVSTVPSRNMSALYGASVGLVLTNDRSFVFGPSLGFLRTDVEDYGTAVIVGLPFEWTTAQNLRVGFELALGRATGGSSRGSCTAFSQGFTSPCGTVPVERSGGTTLMFSFYMGWALGRL